MAIQFEEIFNMNIPFVQAELVRAPRVGGTVRQEYTALIIGQKTSAGTANTEELIDIFSANEARAKFGAKSMLANGIKRYFDINKSVKLKVIALEDESTGTQATTTLTISGTATDDGTFALYINGKAYKSAVSIGDDGEDICAILESMINADDTQQLTALAATNTLTLTAVHKGDYGNTIKTIVSYNSDDVLPEGLTYTLPAMSGGNGNPNLDTVLEILEENQFNMIAFPYTDNSSLQSVDVALTDNFKATEMLDSFAIVSVDDTVTNLTTKANTINSPFVTIMDNHSIFATGFEHSCGVIALVGDVAQSNPGIDYLNRELLGFLPLEQRLRTERNALAGGGVATCRTIGSKIVFDRTVTTFQKDNNNLPIDIDNRDLRLFLAISYVRYSFVLTMSQFQGYKVGGDDDLFGAGTLVMTPNLYKQTLTIIYEQLITDAVCEDLATFEESLIVERAGNRINSSMHINVINVLLQQAMRINYEV